MTLGDEVFGLGSGDETRKEMGAGAGVSVEGAGGLLAMALLLCSTIRAVAGGGGVF